jgi:aspartate aminotransferase-like enzyme
VAGAQKALGGPAGVPAAVISPRGWAQLAANPSAPRESVLSLLDWKEHWIGGGRRQLFATPHHLETRGLAATISRVSTEGLDATVRRHHRARDAARSGVRALGLGSTSPRAARPPEWPRWCRCAAPSAPPRC